jgi:uncharacterized protein YbaP (TraB family)
VRRPAWLLALALVACGPPAQEARPALWQIDGPGGQRGWLFGTIHATPRPYDWRTRAVSEALARSDRIVVEIAALGDDAATARVFARLAHTPGQPPLAARIDPRLRPALASLLAKAGLNAAAFADVETWAAALMLAQAATPDDHPEWGVDRALLADHAGKPVRELEGAERQLALFDRLPEPAQRTLLAQAVAGASTAGADAAKLAEAWRKGDIDTIAAETRQGILADETLRAALFTGRNARWAAAIADGLQHGARPFVAVGAAHMAGPDGLPVMLSARGYRVSRIQ